MNEIEEKDFIKLRNECRSILGEDYYLMPLLNEKIWILSETSIFDNMDEILKQYMGERYAVYRYVEDLKKGELEELKKLSKISYYKRQIEKLENDLTFDK